MRRKLRISSPAPTSRMQAKASSEITSPSRSQACRWPPLDPRLASWSPSRGESVATRNAGSRPKRTPEAIAASNVKRSALPSIRTLASKGRLNAWRWESSRVPATARKSPNTAPQHERDTLSVSICRNSRKRPAPNAVRIAISFCRAPDRANCRFERFAHTINMTRPTAQASTKRAGRTPPLTRCAKGTSRGVM